MIMSERLFVIVGAFLCGYCLGYCPFEFIKYKSKKHEIQEFFLSYDKKYGMQYRLFDEKLEEIKISNNIFLGNDNCEVSYYVNKRSISICCESLNMTENIARNLLRMVDWLMDEHFFQKNGLRELGWCFHYMLDRRSINYHKEKKIFKKTEIIEFY